MWNVAVPDALWVPDGDERLDGLIREVLDQDVVAIDTETTGLSVWGDRPLYWSLAWGDNMRCAMPIDTLHYFGQAFAEEGKRWIFANAKFDMHMLANAGITFAGECVDTQVMHALLYEEEPHGLKEMAGHVLGWRWSDFFDTFPPLLVPDLDKPPKALKGGSFSQPNRKETLLELFARVERDHLSKLVDYASNDAYGTLRIYYKLLEELRSTHTHSIYPDWLPTMEALFFHTEVPFTKVLFECERNGVYIDADYLESLREPIMREMDQCKREAVNIVGTDFNLSSDHDMRDYLFNHLQLRPVTLTKGGKKGIKQPSVDGNTLEHYANEVPLCKIALKYGDLEKTLSTYITGLRKHMDRQGRIHCRLNQDIARTGRLSCVAEWTQLTTDRGDIPISDVKVGDCVWTHRGRWRRVLDAFTKGIEDMYDVRFSNGEVLTCTAAHRLLQEDGTWITVGEVNERFQGVGLQEGQPRRGAAEVPVTVYADDGEHCGTTQDHRSQCGSHPEVLHAGGRAESSFKTSVLGIEERRQEPDEWQDERATPQLERRVRGWAGVSDLHPSGQAGVRSSSSDVRSLGLEGHSGQFGCAPHRHQPKEQQARQPRLGHKGGPSCHSLFAGEGLPGVTIEEIVYRGRFEVFDLTVEEDSSYWACGVFSHNSSNPNLQNIPKPESDNFKLRRAFCAPPNSKTALLVNDYEQLEMRLLACATVTQQHPKGAEEMIQIFLDGKDIHMGNAAMVYGPLYAKKHGWHMSYDDLVNAKKTEKKVKNNELPPEALDEHCHLALFARNAIKSVGFGLNYGMKEAKLARQLGISTEEAKAIIDAYFGTYPAVQDFYEAARVETRKDGFSFSILGRRRFHPAINSYNAYERWSDERKCVNMQIQGAAADVVRMAMVFIHRAGLKEKLGCRMLLQVHDELMFECPEETIKEAQAIIGPIMEHALAMCPSTRASDLAVPLTTSTGIGPSWDTAK
jgi:DNA polymerase I-like protein with 3'-5' exonuclease and polymerase domains